MMNKSLEMEDLKNPMLLSPVITCLFGFLSIDEIKNCRLVCREWGSTGKLVLANRAIVRFAKFQGGIPRLPVDFHSCFLNSTTLFSAFQITGDFAKESTSDSWTVEELTTLFDENQKYVKELTLKFSDQTIAKDIDLSSWIAESPMVQKDAKHLTKLSIEVLWRTMNSESYVKLLDIPLRLIAHIKDLTLSNCKINLEVGIRICPVKLTLNTVTFIQDGIKLDEVLINDIVDLRRAKEVTIHILGCACDTKCVLDLRGNVTLEKLTLFGFGVKTVNGDTSNWVIDNLMMTKVLYSLNRQMKITKLFLCMAGMVDLSTLPNSIQKLTLNEDGHFTTISCSQPIVLENLQYLQIFNIWSDRDCNYVFPPHFMDCPQLTRLKLRGFQKLEMKSLWMPPRVKTLILGNTLMSWVDNSYLDLEKLVVYSYHYNYPNLKVLFEAKIRVNDFVVYFRHLKMENLLDLLKYRKGFNFGKQLYIGELLWYDEQFEDNALIVNEHVDVESSFYVFESDKRGRVLSKNAFLEIAEISKHFAF